MYCFGLWDSRDLYRAMGFSLINIRCNDYHDDCICNILEELYGLHPFTFMTITFHCSYIKMKHNSVFCIFNSKLIVLRTSNLSLVLYNILFFLIYKCCIIKDTRPLKIKD